MKINVKHYHIEVEVNLPDDADMSDIIDSIKGILSICGWSDETWMDQIIELSEHYRKDEQKKLITEIMNDDAKDGLYKTNNMKLYTEEQVRQIIHRASLNRHLTYGDVLDNITPIELPSDEEIEHELAFPNELMNEVTYMFIEGAKWMRDKILNR